MTLSLHSYFIEMLACQSLGNRPLNDIHIYLMGCQGIFGFIPSQEKYNLMPDAILSGVSDLMFQNKLAHTR